MFSKYDKKMNFRTELQPSENNIDQLYLTRIILNKYFTDGVA